MDSEMQAIDRRYEYLRQHFLVIHGVKLKDGEAALLTQTLEVLTKAMHPLWIAPGGLAPPAAIVRGGAIGHSVDWAKDHFVLRDGVVSGAAPSDFDGVPIASRTPLAHSWVFTHCVHQNTLTGPCRFCFQEQAVEREQSFRVVNTKLGPDQVNR